MCVYFATNLIAMKNLNVIFAVVLFSMNLLGQKEHVLVSVFGEANLEQVAKLDAVAQMQQTFTDFTISKAFPDSRNIDLLEVYEISCACDLSAIILELKKFPTTFSGIEYVPAFDLLVEVPNDYSLAIQNDYALDLIQAINAWGITKGKQEVVVGISDSNYDLNHEEFQGKLVHAQPHMSHTNITHGTAVASLAAGATNNSKGKSAIGYNSMLTLHDMSYNSLLAAKNKGAKVINLSWASSCSFISYHQQVINEVIEGGVTIVAAAGNGSTCGGPTNLVYPAAYDGVIAVSSIGPNYNHERTIGNPSTTHQHNASVDLCAPGYDVALALPNNTYGYSSGTSFAAPMVAGTVALMYAVNDRLNHCEVEHLLKSTALNIDSLNENYAGMLGAGALNAFKAVEATVDFENTAIAYIFNEEFGITGQNQIVVSSGAPIDYFDQSLIDTYTNANGDWINEYEVIITYQGGCTVKTSIKEDVVDLQDSIIVLPVEGLNITAALKNNEGVIEWSTESESNSSHFELQKSVDGIVWETLTEVNAAGYATSKSHYSFMDRNVNNTVQYYRLNQFDFNGQSQLSDIVSLQNNNTETIKVYPNPAVNHVSIATSSNLQEVIILDAQGRTWMHEYTDQTQLKFDVSNLPNGYYNIQLHLSNGHVEQSKLVVAH
jgi:subtilisin family serine protease